MGITDVNVKFSQKSTVRASDISIKSYILPLSNFDLLAGRAPVTVMFLYANPHVGNFSSVLTVIKTSLAKTLNHYFPFSGRIVSNATTGEPEIVCNNQGVEVMEVHVDVDLAGLDFHDVSQSLQNIILPLSHGTPFCLQVTSYTCGGFSISCNFDHAIADATTVDMFILSWSEVSRQKPLSRYPNHQRSSIFLPRSPPSYSPSLDLTFCKCNIEELLMTKPMNAYDISVKRLYVIEASDVLRLQKLASGDGKKRSKIEAFSAYLWKVVAVAVEECDTKCSMGWFIEGRRRMVSYQAVNLAGNVLSMGVGELSVEDLKQGSHSHVASVAHETITEVANEGHFLDLLDWIECHRPGMFLANVLLGRSGPAVVVSSGLQFAVKEMDLGFGPPFLGTSYTTISRLGAAYVNPQPNPQGDGSWIVFAMVWPKLAAALESDLDHVFRPLNASRLGLA